jgi:hypothetical protein
MKKAKRREELSIGVIPVTSPGRTLSKKRESLSPIKQTGKRRMIK